MTKKDLIHKIRGPLYNLIGMNTALKDMTQHKEFAEKNLEMLNIIDKIIKEILDDR